MTEAFHSDDVYWSCVRKKAYPDEKMARRVASRAFELRGDRLHVYPCHHCGRYHMARTRKTP